MIKANEPDCWVHDLSLAEQEKEKRDGFSATLSLAQEIFEEIVGRNRIAGRSKDALEQDMHDLLSNLYGLAHLNGYMDCGGQWQERQ